MEMPEGTVSNILDQENLKWGFVGRKGGVGKITCSSIFAILLSAVRQSVLIISTDPAHNLSDAFQQRFTKIPTLVNGFNNLFAMEVDPKVKNDDLMNNESIDSYLSELTNSIPEVDEATSFAEMLKLVQKYELLSYRIRYGSNRSHVEVVAISIYFGERFRENADIEKSIWWAFKPGGSSLWS